MTMVFTCKIIALRRFRRVVMEMRQPHKLCLDLILVSVLLGIGSYIFTMVKPSTLSNLCKWQSTTSLSSLHT